VTNSVGCVQQPVAWPVAWAYRARNLGRRSSADSRPFAISRMSVIQRFFCREGWSLVDVLDKRGSAVQAAKRKMPRKAKHHRDSHREPHGRKALSGPPGRPPSTLGHTLDQSGGRGIGSMGSPVRRPGRNHRRAHVRRSRAWWWKSRNPHKSCLAPPTASLASTVIRISVPPRKGSGRLAVAGLNADEVVSRLLKQTLPAKDAAKVVRHHEV
jgi:hypothetical protein